MSAESSNAESTIKASPTIPNLGVAWNPILQTNAYELRQGEWLLSGINDWETIVLANPSRMGFFIERGNGTTAIEITVGSPSWAPAILAWPDVHPIRIMSTHFPGLTQLQWSGAWSKAGLIRVWEFISLYK